MPVENIKMRRIARELQEWIYLGVQDGMLQSARDYKLLIAQGRTTDAEEMIKRSVDMPYRAIVRIEAYEAQYTTEYLDKCLALYGDCTVSELKTEIEKMKPYALEQARAILNAEIPNSDVADNISSTVQSNVKDWIFPIPASYKDIVTIESEKIAEAVKV